MSHQTVRPSSLALAEFCARAPWLSTKYRASRPVTRFGNAVDRQVSVILSGADRLLAAMESGTEVASIVLPPDQELLPETAKILEWVDINYPLDTWQYYVQHRVTLRDPVTGEELSTGTPDLLCLHRTLPVLVDIDWKKSGQMWARHLPPPDNNIQQLTYLAAAWLEFSLVRKIETGKIVLACWDDRGVTPLESKDIYESQLMQIIERVKAVPSIDVEGPQPEASIGDHCDHCYNRMHCDEHLIPATALVRTGLSVPTFGEGSGGELTPQTAVQALAWLESANRLLSAAEKIRDQVKGNVDAFAMQHGPIEVGAMIYGPKETTTARGGATVATLEAEGLARLIRPGKTKVACKWWKKPENPDNK